MKPPSTPVRVLLPLLGILCILPVGAQVTEAVHPGYTLANLRPDGFQPKGFGGMDWMPDGSLALCTWGGYGRKEGEVLLLSGVRSNPPAVTIRKIAQGLSEPMGLRQVDGMLYVLQRHELSRITVPAGAALAAPVTMVKGWKEPEGDWTYGLIHHQGAFHATQGTWKGGPAMGADQGSWLKLNLGLNQGASYENLAGGLRNPNGIGVGPNNDLFATDNQGNWLPASKLIHLVPGRNYGARLNPNNPYAGKQEYPPAVHVPHKIIGSSPSEPILIPSGPYRGQMLAGDVNFGGIQRYFLEKVAGPDGSQEYQGAVFRFSGGFECGINRLLWGPDGSLYAAGVGGSSALGDLGGWNWNSKWYGLQKLVPKGNTPFDLLAIRSLKDGFELEFTEPVGSAATSVSSYVMEQWRYEPTASYGGPAVGLMQLPVRAAALSQDGRRVRLTVDGLRLGNVVHFKLPTLTSAAGGALWAKEAWYTLNRLGPQNPVVSIARPRLLVFSKTLDYRHAVIPEARAAAIKLGQEAGFDVDTSENSKDFTAANLARYQAVFFNHTTGDVLDSAQQAAFQGFIRKGGGFAALHASSYTELQWPWFADLIGAYFKDHSSVTPGTLKVENAGHPSTATLPSTWTRSDEWYNFTRNPRSLVKVLLTIDEKTYTGGNMGKDHPMAWYHDYDGGRSWYSALGHTPESYKDAAFMAHFRGGLEYALGMKTPTGKVLPPRRVSERTPAVRRLAGSSVLAFPGPASGGTDATWHSVDGVSRAVPPTVR